MIQNKPGCQPNTEWDGCIQETTQLPELSGLRGKITLLTGNRETISLLLVSLAGKLEAISKVLFIDAANCFNPGRSLPTS
ncbi:hypothetical protein HYU14_06485 [Candidatus Woesearchaeota archaeon]|nr:hypothetical protein [Candidatus Woesearchaeota archaeon]